jgi:hypothetical protein
VVVVAWRRLENMFVFVLVLEVGGSVGWFVLWLMVLGNNGL